MTRIMAPDRGAIELEVGNTIYRQPNPHARSGGGAIVVDNPEHERTLLAGGCFRASANPIGRRDSRACVCGKRMWIRPVDGPRVCMRCGRPEGAED
jgi:hypothetical protein